MTSYDGMIFMIIRQVYVSLKVAGPEHPHAASMMCQNVMPDRASLLNST